MKSFTALALCLLLFFAFTTARIPHSYRQLQERNEEPESPNAMVSWLNRFLKRQDETEDPETEDEAERQAASAAQSVCFQDEYYRFVNGSTFGKTVCQGIGIKYPNRTITEDFTPIE